MQQFIGTKIILAEPAKAWKQSGEWAIGADGYKVTYPDGYVSWSPKGAFEEAYRRTDRISFGLAIEAMRKGAKVSRAGWNGKGLWLEIQVPDAHSKMTLPYIFINYPGTPASDTAPKTHINAKVPWLASQTDILADDWMIVG